MTTLPLSKIKLPALVGTDQQVALSETIRQRELMVIDDLNDGYVFRLKDMRNSSDYIDREFCTSRLAVAHAARMTIAAETSAAWWIAEQDQIRKYYVTLANQGHDEDEAASTARGELRLLSVQEEPFQI